MYLDRLTTDRTLGQGIMTLLLSIPLLGCGTPWEGGSGSSKGDETADIQKASAALACGESSHDNSVDEFRIMNLGQSIKRFQEAWGPGSTISVATGSSIFEEYAANFPFAGDKEYSQTVADRMGVKNPYAGLAMAYAIIGHNVGLIAAQADSNNEFFQCDSEEKAADMLNRVYPYRLSCAGEDDPLVLSVTAVCKKSKQNAVAALEASVSAYLRN